MQRLMRLSQLESATTFMLMLTAFAIVLARYSGREDIIIGSPVANRRAETEPLIGPFSAPVPLRVKLSSDPTLREVLRRATRVTLDALDHADLPFEVLFKRLKMRSVQGRNPLFQFYFVYQKAFLQTRQLRELSVTPLPAVSVGTPFELQLAIIERSDGVRANVDYDRHDSMPIRSGTCFATTLMCCRSLQRSPIDRYQALTRHPLTCRGRRHRSGARLPQSTWRHAPSRR